MRSLAARALALVVPPFCWGCGAGARPHEPLCAACHRGLRWLGPDPVPLSGVALWAPLAYEGPARAVVHGLKYRGAPGLAGPMSAQIAASAPPGLVAPPAALVPVPLHPARRRRRGFNQAERLAAALARRTGLEVCDCLRRTGRPSRQVGRGRAERLGGPAGAIELHPRARPPSRALIVDDVATTGATLAACAAALRAAGVQRIAAVAYARTPGR